MDSQVSSRGGDLASVSLEDALQFLPNTPLLRSLLALNFFENLGSHLTSLALQEEGAWAREGRRHCSSSTADFTGGKLLGVFAGLRGAGGEWGRDDPGTWSSSCPLTLLWCRARSREGCFPSLTQEEGRRNAHLL